MVAATYVTVIWELAFAFLVLFRLTRPIALVGGVLIHLGMMAGIEVGPFSLIMLATTPEGDAYTLKEYEQAKEIISKRIYIETMEEILPNVEKVIIEGKAGERVLPYLPLDRLQKQPKATAAAEEKASP